MKKTLEVSVKTQNEALSAAMAEWNAPEEELSVELLERGKSGFLGIGSSLPKYRITWDDGVEEAPAPAPVAEKPAKAPKAEKAPKAPKAPKAEKAAKPQPKAAAAGGEGKVQRVSTFLEGLFERMGVTAQADVQMNEDGIITVELSGQDVGALIGRRGETLDAVQHLANYALNKDGGHTRVTVDAENYRAKRAESLERLAVKMAGKVCRYRRNMTLEPMNAYERHIIHTTLQEYACISTSSTGTEPNRRVVVSYDPEKTGKPVPAAEDDGGRQRRDNDRGDRRDRGGRNDRRGRGPRGDRPQRDETRLVRDPDDQPDYSENLAKAKKPEGNVREWG